MIRVLTSSLTKYAEKDAERYRQEMSNDDTLNAALSVIDAKGLENRYMEAVSSTGASINHYFSLEPGMFMHVEIAGKRTVIAVISLRECLNIPGIQDGSLFRRNVRQSLGDRVKVNKEIALSLKKHPREFFFLYNGITATCSSLKLDGNNLHVENLSVVNGCQSLTTIFGNSETVKKSGEGYILFRFYEIDNGGETDTISLSTNSQNTVKARDLRSNDKKVLELKKAYEHCYPDGQFITKRGEKPGLSKNKAHIIELSVLGKMLITWHVQRPTETHVETKIFSDYFNMLFQREYSPEDVQALK
ncbi:MAG: AIPR family protein [Synergistaceae bacterium]|nr:AIPR family protein [Synergistaceae bacterium]